MKTPIPLTPEEQAEALALYESVQSAFVAHRRNPTQHNQWTLEDRRALWEARLAELKARPGGWRGF